mmetsp:Transcript_22697/g.41276  ORF Transcript_22697/g.41276 Transcript_22697/m.41276 type:complete len:89 (+) Transcript_22697:318-584(+)
MNVSAAFVGVPKFPRNENPGLTLDITTETFVSPFETPRELSLPGGPKATQNMKISIMRNIAIMNDENGTLLYAPASGNTPASLLRPIL